MRRLALLLLMTIGLATPCEGLLTRTAFLWSSFSATGVGHIVDWEEDSAITKNSATHWSTENVCIILEIDRKSTYYSWMMFDALVYLLCSKLCEHNPPKPTLSFLQRVFISWISSVIPSSPWPQLLSLAWCSYSSHFFSDTISRNSLSSSCWLILDLGVLSSKRTYMLWESHHSLVNSASLSCNTSTVEAVIG